MARKVEVRGHFLFIDGVQVPYMPTPNRGGIMSRITGIVDHDTASNPLDPAGDIGWLRMHEAKASAHLVIDWRGGVVQLAPFNVSTWHAGPSRFGSRSNYNAHSIGIEHDNPGYLDATNQPGVFKGVCTIDTNKNPAFKVSAAPVQHNKNLVKYWLHYSPAQIEISAAIHVALKEAYPTIDEIRAHWEICPGRKTDTHPFFPLAKFRALVFGNKLPTAGERVAEVASEPAPKTDVGVPAGGLTAGYVADNQAQAMMTPVTAGMDPYTEITTQLSNAVMYGVSAAGKVLMVLAMLYAAWVIGKYFWIYALKPAWQYFRPRKPDPVMLEQPDFEPVTHAPSELEARYRDLPIEANEREAA